MKRITYLISLILLLILFGCRHATTPNSTICTPISLPIETIVSDGSITDRSFEGNKVDLLGNAIDDIIIKTQVTGISAAVGIPNKGLWCATRGITGNSRTTKITPDLKFCAGSISKIFTAVVILSLEDEGRLHLESSIDKWFPEMPHAADITINHLLTHTSGIATFDSVEEYEANTYNITT